MNLGSLWMIDGILLLLIIIALGIINMPFKDADLMYWRIKNETGFQD